MANIHRVAKASVESTGFRHINDVSALSEKLLNENGYYTGFPCPHNHFIRDSKNHWCYFCVKKILSNVCGFDINYIHTDYKIKYYKLWNQLEIKTPEECWEIASSDIYTPKRVCFPSYRSNYSKQKSENVTFHKAIYQCAWGDIGSLVVTKVCGNPKCGNPLHLISSWNRLYPPGSVTPFEIVFKPEKLMLYGKREGDPVLLEREFKQTISHPLEHKEIEEVKYK
jgi:hypothetical protein